MANILVSYGTTEGQTAQIATYIADVIRARGHRAQVVDVKHSADAVLDGYDGVVVGASIHLGKHERYVAEFVRRNRNALQHLPSAFFSVSLAAHGDSETARRYVDEFEQETGWHPAHVAQFGGALRYTQYGFVKRHLMKRIAQGVPGDLGTDTSRDYVYTEWDEVTRFVEDFLTALGQMPAHEATS